MIMYKTYHGLAFTLVFLFLTLLLPAQGVTHIKGKVLDGETGEPLPFAKVHIHNASIASTADALGNYWLKNVPIEYTDLVFSHKGYDSLLTKVSLTIGRVLNIHARLRPLNLFAQLREKPFLH